MIRAVLLREMLAFTRSLGRGGMIRLMVIYLGLFGLYLPSTIGSPNLALLPFIFFPLYMAGPVGIDTVAGERERNTLETLLSSPLTPWALMWGKVLFSAGAGVVFLILSLGTSVAFRALRGMPVASAGSVGVVLGVCLVCSVFGAVLGMHVSLKARSARTAQQWFAAVIAVVFVGTGALLKLFADRFLPGLKGTLETVFSRGWESPSVLIGAGIVLLVTGALTAWLGGRMKRLWKLNAFR